MARKSDLPLHQRMDAVLSLFRREKLAHLISRRYGISENTLYRWRDQFLEGGKSGLGNDKKKSDPKSREISAFKKEIDERDRVIGELAIANRVLKKISDDLN